MVLRRVPQEIWVLVVAAFAIALGYGLIAPILPQFARSFDVGFAAASAIVTVFALVRLIFAPGGGALVRRFGERSVYLVGLSIVAVSTGAVAFAQTYWQLMIFRGIGGVGSVLFTVSSMGLLARLSPPDIRGRVASLYGSAFLLGNILGPSLGSAMSGLGYQLPFLLYAGALGIATAVVAIFLSGTRLDQRTSPTREVATLDLRDALKDSAYRALLASSFANGWSNFGVRIALLPLMAAAVPGLGAAWAGIALTAFALGNVLMQQLTGRLVDARGRRPTILIGLAATGTVTFAFGWTTTLPLFLGLSVLAGMGTAFIAPAQQATLSDVLGRDRRGGQAVAAVSMAGDFGSVSGSLLSGLVADLVGFGWAFALTGVVLWAASIPWLRAREPMARKLVQV